VREPLTFHTLDVFTGRAFAGNPLAVVENADALDDARMQAIAREFNLSETVFLRSPKDPLNTAAVRIFTPTGELPFAGHPTVGAAVLLAETRAAEVLARQNVVVTLEAPAGALRCEVIRSRASGVSYAEFATPFLPQPHADAPAAEAIAAALGLDVADIGFDGHAPLFCAAGPSFLFAPLASAAALDRAAKRAPHFGEALSGAIGLYAYTRETVEEASAIQARMFAHGQGFDEDPATGSAAAAFACVALAFESPEDGEHELFIEQGRQIGRPSRITLRMQVAEGRLAGVEIGGQAVRVSEGRLFA
jgi:trans-2,3-dihydro-3-hydroxyanthranilate isomerase